MLKIFLSPKIITFKDNVEKYISAGQPTNDDIILRMRHTCRITNATDTHTHSM